MSMSRFEIFDAIGFTAAFVYCRLLLWNSSFGISGMMALVGSLLAVFSFGTMIDWMLIDTWNIGAIVMNALISMGLYSLVMFGNSIMACILIVTLVECVAVSAYFMNRKIKKGKDILLVLDKRFRKCALISMIMLSCCGAVITILVTFKLF